MKVFFNSSAPLTPLLPPNSRGKVRVPKSKDLNYYLNCSEEGFVNFVKGCFTWEMTGRMKPAEVNVLK
jgi:dual specificity tyrosine-phosphorylation-regulated kinase 2/3/4